MDEEVSDYRRCCCIYLFCEVILDANDQRMRRDYEQKKRRSKEESAQDVRFFARSLSDNVDL